MSEISWIEIALVVATGILALITWYGTRSSNNLLKKELEIRYRPSLARIDMQFSQEDIKLMLVNNKATFRIKNYGAIAAVNISIEYYVKIRENDKDINMKSSAEKYPDGKPESSLAPEESYGVDIPMDEIHIKKMLVDDTCHFGLIIWYSSPNHTTKYQYKMEAHFDRGEIMLHDTTNMT
jgi:hypothetical protein